jgi:AcrR family transcriptional regulator
MPRRRRPDPEPALKRAILDAARDLFSREGLEAVSMRRVAAAADCSATAIYIYFRDKDALVEALVLEDFLDLAQGLEQLGQVADPILRLRMLGEAFARYAAEKPNHYRFLFMTMKPAVRPEAAQGRGRPDENAYLMARVAAEEALASGRIRPGFVDGDALIQTLLAGIHGVMSLHISNFSDPWIPWKPLDQRVQMMLDTLLRGLQVAE